MRSFLKLLRLSIILLVAFASISPVQAAVTLISFEAMPDTPNLKAILVWETGSELDFAGFNIQRSLSPDSDFQQINGDLIPAQGKGGVGATYIYTDTEVAYGVIYYYRLEMVDLGGGLTYSDSVSTVLEQRIYLPMMQK